MRRAAHHPPQSERSTLLICPLPPAGDKKSRCVKQVFGKPWKSGKPTKCAKRGFQGKCRKSCDDYWGPKTDIEFCTPKGTMSWLGSKEELMARLVE